MIKEEEKEERGKKKRFSMRLQKLYGDIVPDLIGLNYCKS